MATQSHIFSPLMYIAHLAQDLGPRGATTPSEIKAAVYVRRVLTKLGARKVESQRFRSAVKLWRPYILCLIMGLIGAVVYSLGGTPTQLLASFLSGLGAWSIYRELNFEDNPARRLMPTGPSENVIGTIPPEGETRATVVLIGHLDSGQTPLLFSTPWLLPLFVVIAALAVASLVVNAVLYLLGAVTSEPAWYDWSWIGTAIQSVALVFAMEAELSPHTEGANDNASAVGVVVSLAQYAIEQRLKHTEVWTLLSGCEEVGCYGMASFLEAYKDSLRDAYFINLEAVGCGDLCYAVGEGMGRTHRSDPSLIDMAEQVGKRRPELRARPEVLRIGYTETGVVAKNQMKGITVLAMKHNGLFSYVPYWHQREDVFENLDEQTLNRAREFVWEMMQEIDHQCSTKA